MTARNVAPKQRYVLSECEPDVAPPPGAIVLILQTRTAYYETAAGHRHPIDLPPLRPPAMHSWRPEAVACLAAQTYLDMLARTLSRPLFIFGMKSKIARENGDNGNSDTEIEDEDD